MRSLVLSFLCFSTGTAWSVQPASAQVSAQPTTQRLSPARVELHGLEAEEVEKSFGAPDQKQGSESGRETWSYGRSIILFREGKVSAWSDAGELSRRMKLAGVRLRETEAEQEREMWKNPWTPQLPITDEIILEELINRARTQPIAPGVGVGNPTASNGGFESSIVEANEGAAKATSQTDHTYGGGESLRGRESVAPQPEAAVTRQAPKKKLSEQSLSRQ